MKINKFFAIAMTALSLVAFASCTEKEEQPKEEEPQEEEPQEEDQGTVTVNPSEIALNFTGDPQIVKIVADANWSAAADAAWVILSSESGFASEEGEDLVISAETATETEPRSCTVTITLAKGATATIKVSQDGKPDGGISTADELICLLGSLEGYPADGNYFFKNDIDMAGQTGITLAEFNGTLDGNGYKILNYVVSGKPLVGTNNGTIKNIVIDETCSRTEDAAAGISTKTSSAIIAQVNCGTIEGIANFANLSRKSDNGFGEATSFGVIASTNEATGVIKSCTNSGTLTFVHDVTSKGNIYGGNVALASIVGTNNGTVEACSNNGALVFDSNAIGKCYNAEITAVGGIAGINNAEGTITACTNQGAIDFKMVISSKTLYVGGIAGINNEGKVEGCTCDGNITVDGTSEEASKLPNGTADVNAGLICGNSEEAAGNGTVTVINIGIPDPELHITSAEDFANFLSTAGSYPANAKIYLDNDIDISATEVGTCADTLVATFDGQGHHINGINELRKEKCFFKYNAGTVKNVILGTDGDQENVILGNFSTEDSCPIIARYNLGTVENCTNYVSYGRANDKNFGPKSVIFGFIVGTNKGTVKDCVNYGKLYMITTVGKFIKVTKTTKAYKNYFGTIVGNNDASAEEGYAGTISGCTNYGGIYLPSGEGAPVQNDGEATKAGYLYVGNICGRNGEGATIDGCTNEGVMDIDAGITGSEGCDNTVRFGLIYGGGNGTATNCTVKGSLSIDAFSDSTQEYYYGAISGKDTPGEGNTYTECTLTCNDNNSKGIRNPNE